MMEELIIKKYANSGRISPNGELYLPLKLADDFVQYCIELNVVVVGLEFFHIKARSVIPANPINGIDCSPLLEGFTRWEEVVKNINEDIIDVLKREIKRDCTQYFNPTLLEEHEWSKTK